MDITHQQYLAALAALELDPETTESVNLARAGDGFWVRIVHTDKPVVTGPVVMPEPDPEPTGDGETDPNPTDTTP